MPRGLSLAASQQLFDRATAVTPGLEDPAAGSRVGQDPAVYDPTDEDADPEAGGQRLTKFDSMLFATE